MKFRPLGSTNLEVSILGFGGASVSGEGGGYGFGDISEAKAQELIEAACDAKINLFDTAPVYGFGLSEKRIGKALKPFRDKKVIVSKSGVSWHDNKRVNMTNDPVVTQKMLEQSLRDLNTDYIDVYMIHWPDAQVDIRRPLEVLAKAQGQGKIKHVGLCNTNMDDLKKSEEICRVDVVQTELNCFNRNVISELFPYIEEKGIGFMSWGTLDKGILTGKTKKDSKFDESDCRSWAPWWKKSNKNEKIDAMEKVLPILVQEGVTPVNHAFNFVLSNHQVSTALCGFKNVNQLQGLMDSLKKFDNRIFEKTLPLLEV